MFKHFKDLEYTVHVDRPDPLFALKLHEQFGGPNGELKAAMQYFTQSLGCNNPQIRDLMQDIAAEELSHLEMVGEAISMLLGDMSRVPKDFPAAYMAIESGGPALVDATGTPWTANYVNSNGDIYADLRSNVAAELRAKLIYERLLQQTDDPGVKDMIRFLLSREESHSFSFTKAIETVQGQGVMKDFRDSKFSKMYVDTSTGQGSAIGPWNQGNEFICEQEPQKKYGGLPAYGHDPKSTGAREMGPGYADHTRNNPYQYQQYKRQENRGHEKEQRRTH